MLPEDCLLLVTFFQGHPFSEIFGGFWCLVSAVDFLVDFCVEFFGPFSLGKQAEKNPPKNPQKNPRFSRQLFDQNPLREISALTFLLVSRLFRGVFESSVWVFFVAFPWLFRDRALMLPQSLRTAETHMVS